MTDEPHCREIQALRRDIDDLRAQHASDLLEVAGLLSGLEDQVVQLRRELADERRLNGPMRGRISSLEAWAS